MLESDGPGGAEMVMLRLAEGLRSRGHRIVPVGPDRGCGWLAGQFRERGFDPRTFTLRRPLDWRCLTGLVRMLRAERVDAIHSHEFTMALYGMAAARWLGVPHVITMHGSQYVTTKWRRRASLRLAFRGSTATVAVSADTKRHLDQELSLPSARLQVIPNGVPVPSGDAAAARAELGLAPDELLLLAVGSLVPRKGHAVLVRAMAALRDSGVPVPWRLAIAGGGAEREALAALVESLGLRGSIHLLGHRDDVASWQVAADVFVMPSLWEGLPLALLEAMATGSAVIASRTSGIPEAVTDGVDGLLTPPGDVAALAAAVRRVLGDAALRRALGDAARARVAREFSMERMTAEYEALYLPGRRAGAGEQRRGGGEGQVGNRLAAGLGKTQRV
ncbi:MAG TPA: glycosyltransferase [Gemmatimonadaceae bacterium]|nr:glycosyltransferase [Gemmatimonadaceae bacterium]